MARYTGPSYKQARRVGFSISENGKDIARRPYGPGQHGADRKGKLSNYGVQLKEKQKVDLCMVLMKSNLKKLSEKLVKCKEFMVKIS